MIYSEKFNYYIQNDGGYASARHLSVSEASIRDDGVGILARSEWTGELKTEEYQFNHEDNGRISCLMACLPTSENNNGYFAVGLVQDSENFSNLLLRIYMTNIGLLLLIAVCLSFLALVVVTASQKNRILQKKAAMLKEQNEQITDTLSKQQELAHHQRLETIGYLTSGISHEFNNLLTPIMGYSIMALEYIPKDDEELYNELTEIYRASSKAKSLVSRISALSKKSSVNSLVMMSPDRLVNSAVEMAKHGKPDEVGIEEVLNCPEECIFVNETEVGQLLLNLLINAIHATTQNGGKVTIGTYDEGETVSFTVLDNGCGIPEDSLEKIFEPFFSTKDTNGTGLGLAISKQIAENYGGTLTVRSKVGVGTEFTFRLPKSNGKKEE